ncbi:hypothetical protein [Marinobacter sp. 2_MG-2023]|uniref:hypothetical protein n=1 Tax=Marinobacter sp. 2_MG-2023 TaxID=3062679 RepID=UPI0026E34BCE|nr:hypothetical protein [Marinobacter sp. 2_MG-2023]MDO6442061.1 hypothetical protein [Marinobacter sp. 2_MG-2023]
MSTKASISSGENYDLYYQELLSAQPKSVLLELNDPQEFRVEKETFKGKSLDVLVVEIPSNDMDKIAIDWIKKRKLQGAVGGPVGLEWGSSDCPWE